MNFNQIINSYISELTQEFNASKSGETTAELSFRTSLDNFFKSVAKSINSNIVTIPEPKNQNKIGRPDWRFHNSQSMGVYGYVEAKGLDSIKKINIDTYRTQVEKYLSLGNPVILTDGIDFVLFREDQKEIEYSICNKPISWDNIEPNLEIEEMFSLLFSETGYRIVSENQLVQEVAKRTKLLTNAITEFLNLDEDETESEVELKTVRLLKELKETAVDSHDKTLIDDSTFSGFISQVLTFGLLYAHRIINAQCETPPEKYNRIHEFWFSVLDEEYTNRLMPFKTLVKGLESELNSELSRLGLWYDDLRRLLAHIKLSINQEQIPDFHELYETFLAKYDPATRFDYGAFYTPRVLAFYTTRLAQEIIKNSLPSANLDAPTTKFIDPCCGTGTFIEAILEILKPKKETPIIGFEILPAPYALAHYRMSIINEEYPENINIKLTNTLSDNLFDTPIDNENENNIKGLLVKEQQAAYTLSIPPLTLIIGNPPSSDSSFQIDNEGDIIKKLIDDFRPDAINRTSRQNTQKQLSNEFIKFLRWTIDRTLKSAPSVFALILPSSFAKHPTYKYARKFLIENLNEIWLLDFDSDLRSGSDNVNLFDTQQGRLILCGVFESQNNQDIAIKYNSITNLNKKEKKQYFQSQINLSDWIDIAIDSDEYSLKPKLEFDTEIYNSFWSITNDEDSGIFLRHCSGLKLAPTHLLVHSSSGQLKRRSKFISKFENDFESIKHRWYIGQRKIPNKTKITEGIKTKLGNAITFNNILKYSYRPFLESYVVLDDSLLQELQGLGGGGTRVRPEVKAAFSNPNVFGFIVSPAPEDLGDKLHKFTSFCWNIPDNDLSKRGSARIFCNYFPHYKSKKDWDSKCYTNVNQVLIEAINEKMGYSVDEVVSLITFYSYAILSSNFFLELFKGALYGVAGNWPRIPITADKRLFDAISKIGIELAEIEKSDYSLIELDDSINEFSFEKYNFKDSTIELKDDTGKIVKQYCNISPEVLDFEVSGYNVIKEWLKMHSFSYYRKSLEKEKIQEFLTLIEKIHIYIEKIKELDLLVEELLENEIISPIE